MRFQVFETNGYLSKGMRAPGVSAHVWDSLWDEVVAIYRTEDYKGRVRREEKLRRVRQSADEHRVRLEAEYA